MDSFTLTSVNPFHVPIPINKRRNSFCSTSRPFSFLVLASKDESQQLNSWDEMELKFGRMLGEDPKLTLAKIKGRKANPDVSYLEIEKAFNKKNFQMDEVVEEFKKSPPNSLNLARPVPKKGAKFEEDDNARMLFESQKNKARLSSPGHVVDDRTKGSSIPNVRPPNSLNLVRPVPKNGVKFEEDDNAHTLFESQKNKARLSSPGHVVDIRTEGSSIPNVILRKPSAAFPEDDIEVKKSRRFQIKPNLSLKMSKGETKENFSDITLLKKPEPTWLVIDSGPDNVISGDYIGSSSSLSNEGSTDSLETSSDSFPEVSKTEDEPTVGLQLLKQGDFELDGKENYIPQPEVELQGKPSRLDQSAKNTSKHAIKEEGLDELDKEEEIIAQPEVGLQGKPSRLDNYVKDTSKPVIEEAVCHHTEIDDFLSEAPLKDCEEADWSKAEYLCNTGGRDEVELISCSIRGFVASFGSLIGFLPYRNLGTKWKFLAFESWLRKKGLDPSMYRQNLGIVGRYESRDKNLPADPNPAPEKIEGKLSPDMKLEDLLEIYDQEKIKFLSSFIGLRLKVNVVLADKNSRKLMFSGKPKEKEEMILKKRSLMEKLNVGDVVKCCIKKITYFGIFVEVEGVPALIHQSEVSWDATMDPTSFFKIGQIVEAKVHQLDFALDRITLSLKEITPDPLIEALESVVGDCSDLEGSVGAAHTDTEWADVKSLIKELEDIEGVLSVSKGRFFLSPGLAPTFQVYMASMFQNQYKLLARSGNKVQEIIVQASLDKEEMKAAILACTNRVA